ncbi:RsmE family RNA methyltransferase [candidate division GN15 bacterium]|nr:RsmE family RNA methyltransferase [candidate division GN15 bacterium]
MKPDSAKNDSNEVMNLIILTEDDEIGEGRYRLTDHRAEHIRKILKLGFEDHLQVGLLNGPHGRAFIQKIDDSEVVLECERLWLEGHPIPEITLVCALPRPQILRKVLFVSAMMGVHALHLIRANRVEKSFFESKLLEAEQYRPHLIEGLSQGKRTQLPKVAVHDRFKVFFEDTWPTIERAGNGHLLKLLADPDTDRGLHSYPTTDAYRIAIAVGPEGGWVPFELDLMHRAGFESFTLGKWMLRVEYAVTAALSQLELLRLQA